MDNITLFFSIFGLSNKSPFLDVFMIVGARVIIFVAFLLMVILTFRSGVKEKKAFILAIISIPVIILLIKIIHIFFYEPRPFITFHFSPLFPYRDDASFPSRHASMMAAVAFSYTYFKSKWAALFLLFMIWVGISRIFVGVHYPIDIIGGILTGLVSIIIAKQIVRFLKIKFSLS